MVALRKDGSVYQCLVESRVADCTCSMPDRDLAQKFFAATEESEGTLNGEPYMEGKTHAPILKKLAAYLECKVVEIVEDNTATTRSQLWKPYDVTIHKEIKPLTVTDSPWQYGG